MPFLEVTQHSPAVNEALEVLTAVTTTQPGVGRRNTLDALLHVLEESLAHGDPVPALRWAAIECEREQPRDIANMVFACAHALARRIGRAEPHRLGEVVAHFARVRAHVEHALYGSPTELNEEAAFDAAVALIARLPSATNILDVSLEERNTAMTA